MPKEEWGVKRLCPETGKRFFDMNRDPIVSPYTGDIVNPETGKSRTMTADKAEAKTDEDDLLVDEADVVLDDDNSDVDLGDDVLDDDDEDTVPLDDIADVAANDDDDN
ncbi:MAG: TIGR02300 family protein [Paracoccaceae bacterium]|nr:hypothetical protein RB2150_07378 [Rhodobacterales bacterium HTCC2150] [Rhodobacteraceae bacterium HTCC2150]MDG1532357.1 TIGR02300 family protein [Paracoccaceae bacterium]